MPKPFPRVNLYKEDIEHLVVTQNFEATEEIIEWIESQADSREDFPSIDLPGSVKTFHSVIEYQASKKLAALVVVVALATQPDDSSQSEKGLRVTIGSTYIAPGIEKHGRSRKLGVSEQELVNKLSSLTPLANSTAKAIIRYVYEDVRGEDLWFPLPSTLSGGPSGSELFELQGVRGRKIGTDDHTEYRFQLEHNGDGKVVLRLDFRHPDISPFDVRSTLAVARPWAHELVKLNARLR